MEKVNSLMAQFVHFLLVQILIDILYIFDETWFEAFYIKEVAIA